MIIAVLQARLSSSRLLGKVLKPLLGEPMLARQIERVKRARNIDHLVVATSLEPEDQAIAQAAKACGAEIFRGSLDDVLDRFYQAARPHNPDLVVRLTGDCPLADWQVIDKVIDFAVQGDYDYASNTLNPTWPDGLDVEVMRFSVLEAAWREAEVTSDREHVTPFIYRHNERFSLGSVENSEDLSGLRWTVDEPEDFEFVRCIFETLYPGNPDFLTGDILNTLQQNPRIARLNAHIGRNEGFIPDDPGPIKE